MTQTVKLTIPRKGLAEGKAKVSVIAEGFTGEACIASTHSILQNIGKVIAEATTEDFYKQPDRVVEAAN